MTEFANPLAFLLLLPVFLLPLQRYLTGRHVLALPSLEERHRRLSLRLLLAWVPSALQFAGLVLIVVALARPRVTRRDVMVESEGLDIILAVDTSGSMRAEDFSVGVRPVNRLQVAKGVMGQFIEGRPHDRIGVVVFGEEAFTHVPLTLDHTTLLDIMDQVRIGIAGAQGTAIGSAIAVSAKRLKDLEAPNRLVILLTDGQNNAGEIGPLEAAQAAAALDITLYTIGVGDAQQTMYGSLTDGLDDQSLTRIAKITGGQYFRATDANSLQQIYETIDELEPSPAEVLQLVSHEERFRTFLIPGVGFARAAAAVVGNLATEGTVSLAQPWWLAWLPALVVLAGLMMAGAWLKRARLRAVFSAQLMSRVVPPLVRIRRVVRDGMALVGVALALLAIAEPRFGKQIQTLKASGTDLVLILDLSRSMDAEDVDPSRLERARREISDLSRLATGDRIGLVVFAGAAYPRLPLTQDYRALELVVSETTTETFRSQGSDLASALREANKLLGRSQDQAGQAIVVLSDGETHKPDEAMAAAQEVSGQGIRVYAMGIGIEPAPIPLPTGQMLEHQGQIVTTRPDFRVLERVAEVTGGAFVKSNASDRDMQDLYREIRANVQAVERSSQKRETWKTAFQWPLAAALALLLLAAWLGDGLPWLFHRLAAVLAVGLALGSSPAWADSLAEADEKFRSGRYAEAAEILTELSLQSPDDADLLERLGAARYRAKDWDGAARAFDHAARLRSDPDALFNSGNAHYQAGRLEQALDRFDQALAADEDHESAQRNRDLVAEEIVRRRQVPPPPPPSGGSGEEDEEDGSSGDPNEPQPNDASQSGDKPTPQGDSDQQEPSDTDPAGDPSETEASERPSGQGPPDPQGSSEAVDVGELDPQPTEGDPLNPEESSGEPNAGPITEGQAHRLLDAIEEGKQRVTVTGQSEGKPW